MIVQVKLFGPQAQLAGTRQIAVELADGAMTCEAVLRAIGKSQPALSPSLGKSRLAVNHEFASPRDAVGPNDELALIGPVSGG